MVQFLLNVQFNVIVKRGGGCIGFSMDEPVPYLTAHCVFLCQINVVGRDAPWVVFLSKWFVYLNLERIVFSYDQ